MTFRLTPRIVEIAFCTPYFVAMMRWICEYVCFSFNATTSSSHASGIFALGLMMLFFLILKLAGAARGRGAGRGAGLLSKELVLDAGIEGGVVTAVVEGEIEVVGLCGAEW